MAITIPAPLIDFILLGPFDDRRQLQDTPIRGDVWAEFGEHPAKPVELLIAPFRGRPAGSVAKQVSDHLLDAKLARISCVHGFIAARMTFDELLRGVVPFTEWWARHFGMVKRSDSKRHTKGEPRLPEERTSLATDLKQVFEGARVWHLKKGTARMREIPAVPRFVALAGLILMAAKRKEKQAPTVDAQLADLLGNPALLAEQVQKEFTNFKRDLPTTGKEFSVFSISRNRKAMPALERSVAAVKADAVQKLFSVDCGEIGWAVLDSGIDASHPAFRARDGKTSRVQRAFDFRRYRELVSLSNADKDQRTLLARTMAQDSHLLNKPTFKEADDILQSLANGALKGGAVRWNLVERLVEIKPDTPPDFSHGTHVAGIIGASEEWADESKRDSLGLANGMCPDIQLYDFRVLAPDFDDTEFAIIAALQFIRHLNQQDTFMAIHGANLSLSIPHSVRNYACGQTPICDECNRLSENGVVVVAAAGNHGYKSFTTNEGTFDGYAAFSITDPGNADDVITVGATHRFSPHTYGVSFFSSRGPTGDGRMKPDLVAPGERIRAPLMSGQWGDLDGTSMAAPHVSGAAAMLMARYSEFRGRPRRIKQILCETATDLGRERSFQGRGMLDVLRAFQSI